MPSGASSRADQAPAARQGAEAGDAISHVGSLQVDPAHHADDPRMGQCLGQLRLGFGLVMAALDEHAGVDGLRVEQWAKVRVREGSANRFEFWLRHPRVGGLGGIPEMLVRVDGSHATMRALVGAA